MCVLTFLKLNCVLVTSDVVKTKSSEAKTILKMKVPFSLPVVLAPGWPRKLVLKLALTATLPASAVELD